MPTQTLPPVPPTVGDIPLRVPVQQAPEVPLRAPLPLRRR